MKAENRLWGPKRIHGELLKLGFEISETSVRNILRRANLNPWNYTPSTTWREFIQRHERVWAMDFFTVHSTLLKRMYVLVVMDLRSRVLITTKVTSHPTGEWVSNVLREQMFQQTPNGIIMDRDPAFSDAVLKNLLRSEKVRIMRCPRRSPKANAFVERLNGTLQRECTDHFLFMNERQLQKVLDEYKEYYNQARCHQGLDQNVPFQIEPKPKLCTNNSTQVDARQFLGGLHHEYIAAA